MMKILVAEDNLVSQNILEKILEKSGHEVMTAENGLKAWELLQRNSVRMVITDWMMPEMDGLELCQKLHSSDLPDYY